MNAQKFFVTELVTPYWSGKCVVLERTVVRERNRFGYFQSMDFIHIFKADSSGGDHLPAAQAVGLLPDPGYCAPVGNPRNLRDEEKAAIIAALT